MIHGPAAPEPWSHNVHYHRVILDAVPAGCQRALDVGCGTGALTRRLRSAVPEVTGIDRDERSIELARSHPDAAGVSYVLGDFREAPLRAESFDLITAVASLHHMDEAAALERMRDLLRPGGVLAIVGLGRFSLPDLALVPALLVPAVAGTRLHLLAAARDRRRSGTAGPAGTYKPPIVWPPPSTYRYIRRLARRLLPGSRYRRHLYWRYSLVWTKPALTSQRGRRAGA